MKQTNTVVFLRNRLFRNIDVSYTFNTPVLPSICLLVMDNILDICIAFDVDFFNISWSTTVNIKYMQVKSWNGMILMNTLNSFFLHLHIYIEMTKIKKVECK